MKHIALGVISLLLTLNTNGQYKRSVVTVHAAQSISPILAILKETRAHGSLGFDGKCESFTQPGFPDFPMMDTERSASGSALQRLRLLFSFDPSMRVRQVDGGGIEMMEEGVPQDILNVTIADINFKGSGKSVINNPNGAVNFVLYSPEVQEYIALHSISFPYSASMASGIIGGVPDPRLPQISSRFHNVTVRFLLNEIANTFQSLWVYENCPINHGRPRVVYIRFYQP